jgi:hypothetical protein
MQRCDMKRLYPVPSTCVDDLKREIDTGMGYKVVSVQLCDGRSFEQVIISEGHIIEVRGYKEIPFLPKDVASLSVNHKQWNFRTGTDVTVKSRAMAASN